MKDDLRRLVDDPRFQQYHEQRQKPPEFSAFDVLRNADYEIRHSNVLAWLLDPGETHGIGGVLLEWLVDHINERAEAAGIKPIGATDFEASNVEVRREYRYVDIAVFFENEKDLIAIENKIEAMSSAHARQVAGYEADLRNEHKDYRVRSALLTTSADEPDARRGFVPLSWESVYRRVNALHEDGRFRPEAASAFVRQYLDMVKARVLSRPTPQGAVEELVKEHNALLNELVDVRSERSDGGVESMVPADGAEYRNSVIRLVEDFRRQPEQWRSAARAVLQQDRGDRKTGVSVDRARTEFWLYWEDSAEVEKRLGLDSCLRWGMGFWRRKVTVCFLLFQWPKGSKDERHQKMQANLERLKRFLSETPVDRRPSGNYPNDDRGDYFYVYERVLIADDELARLSPSGARMKVQELLKEFLSEDDSDYRRIQDYFACLAFQPEEAGKRTDEASS